MNQLPSFEYLGTIDLSTGKRISWQRRAGEPPFDAVHIKNEGGDKIIRYDGFTITPSRGELVQVPPHAPGYFRYSQAGKEVFYHSLEGEILWQREYHSYPSASPTGEFIFMITGDGNLIEILDENGNPAPVPSIAGNILNSYEFSGKNNHACVAFSNIVRYVLNGGERVLDYIPETNDGLVFLKSCNVSYDGLSFALHYQAGDDDHIAYVKVEYDESEDRYDLDMQFDVTLDEVFPHLIYMAVGETKVIASLPKKIVLFDDNGDILDEEPVSWNSAYRPVYSGENFYVAGKENEFLVFDGQGRRILDVSLPSDAKEGVWRFFNGIKPGVFALESASAVHFYSYYEAGTATDTHMESESSIDGSSVW